MMAKNDSLGKFRYQINQIDARRSTANNQNTFICKSQKFINTFQFVEFCDCQTKAICGNDWFKPLNASARR